MNKEFEILQKYNFWNGKFPDLGYVRKEYLSKISEFTNNKLVKILVGQRRVGKSYVLRQIAQSLTAKKISPKNIFYLSREFTDFDFVKNHKDLDKLIKLYLKEIKPKGKVYLFIDEIQNISMWEKLVNSYSQDFSASYEIFISGSNSQMLSGELATLLSGRYIQFEIFPLSFDEYCNWIGKKTDKQNYLEFLQSGGLPELLNLQSEESKRNYTASVKDTVFLRDIIERYKISEPKLLEDIFVYLLNNPASLISIPKILNFFKSKNRKTTYDTIANYIGYMQDAFLIHKVERFNIRGKDTIAGNCKYYINDLSYKNYLYPGFDFAIGKQLENLIYLQLRRNGFLVFTGCLPNNEIDFVAVKNDATIYFQIAYILSDEKVIEREYAALEKIKDNYEKYVISLDDVKFHIRNGINHIQAWNLSEIL